MPVFTSGIVLLLSIWGGKRSGLFLDPYREMDDVHKCMKALNLMEGRLHTAGRLWCAVSIKASLDLISLSLGIFSMNSHAWRICHYSARVSPRGNENVNGTHARQTMPPIRLRIRCRRIQYPPGSSPVLEEFVKSLRLSIRRNNGRYISRNINSRK